MEITIPLDLISEVLIRLPANSIRRFKSVSKTWKTLISSPSFINLHAQFVLTKLAQLDPPTSISFLVKYDKGFNLLTRQKIRVDDHGMFNISPHGDFTMFPDFPHGHVSECLGSSHGLICMTLGSNEIAIWNPILGECKKIPFPNVGNEFCCLLMHYSWFGYVPSVDDFIILFVAHYRTHHRSLRRPRVHCFSMKDNVWREVDTLVLDEALLLVFERGGLSHYRKCKSTVLMRDTLHFGTIAHGNFMLTFNLIEHVFNKIPLTMMSIIAPISDFVDSAVVITKDHNLSFSRFIEYFNHEDDMYTVKIESWMLKRYGEFDYSWQKLIDTTMNDIPYSSRPAFLGFLGPSGNILMTIGDIVSPCQSIVVVDPNKFSSLFKRRLYYYTETLISPFSLH